MANDQSAYLRHVEWEGMQEGCKLVPAQLPPGFPDAVQSIELSRDDGYMLQCQVKGTIVGPHDPRGGAKSGDPIPVITLIAHDGLGGHTYTIEAYRTGYSESWSIHAVPEFSIHLRVLQVRRTSPDTNRTAAVRLTEWYLNGPANPTIYTRTLVRHEDKKYTKRVFDGSVAYPPLEISSESQLGCVPVQFGDRRLLLVQVPNECGPDWSHKLGIEYRVEWGKIPAPEDRTAISEVVGFILGRRLIPVGHTTFDASGSPLEEVAIIPWGENSETVCQRSDLPPTEIGPLRRGENLESLLPNLIPSYLKAREELGIKDALWRYWLAREIRVPEISLPVVAAGLERLADHWVVSKRSKTTGVYLPKDEWDAITKDLLPTINASLTKNKGQKPIINKIKEAYKLSGVNEKRQVFLSELKLPIGKVEKKALASRHGPAHGSTDSDYRKMGHNMDAYDTLFNRVLLKILGFTGTYIDRSARGHPPTPLDTPMAGWSDQQESNDEV